MTANPVDLIGGMTSTANVPKADVSAWAKARVPQVMASFTELRSTVLASQLVVTFKTTGGFWFQDTADTTTADDGLTCVVSADGFRYKPLSVTPLPTAISLGGVFSHAAVSHFYVTGINTDGSLFTAQPSLADLTDSITQKDTDGTFAANSDTRIATQKATKTYVDTVAQGLDPKPSVIVATTANITLSAEQTIDGILTSASRVLVKNQSTPSQNGIYVSGSGSWTRALDFDSWLEIPGAYTFVEQGTTFGDCGFVCTANAGGTLGSTAITFTQFSGAGTYTNGTGLSLSGTVFSIDSTVATLTGSQALTNKSYNGNTWTAGTGVLTIAAGKTLTANATVTFGGTDGKTLTLSNTLTLAGTDSSTLNYGVGGTLTGSSSAAIFYDNIPQNSKSAAYTTVLADAQKHIFHPDADTTARTFTIDSNANVAYPIGTVITFVNGHGAGVVTIAITADTMRLAGPGTTGSRMLAADGMAIAIKITATEWRISGTGLT